MVKHTYSQISKTTKITITTFIYLSMFAACSDDEAEIAAAQKASLVGNKIECALNGSQEFILKCATERVSSGDDTLLLIRHYDGGFRRFRILTDGRGLENSEGFDDSVIEIIDNNNIILSSGLDRYKLKAQLTGGNENATFDEDISEGSSEAIIADTNSVEGKLQLNDADVGPIGRTGVPYKIPR